MKSYKGIFKRGTAFEDVAERPCLCGYCDIRERKKIYKFFKLGPKQDNWIILDGLPMVTELKFRKRIKDMKVYIENNFAYIPHCLCRVCSAARVLTVCNMRPNIWI